jgi:putative ABC transport system permease protein
MSSHISWTDLKLGIRILIKHPALTIVGGLGMAMAVAINVGVFSFMVAYIYPTLPLEEGDRIVALENRDIALNEDERRSLHDFFVWREQLTSVKDLAAFRTVERNLRTGAGPPVAVQSAEMTAAGFGVARVAPMLGRYLLEDDEQPGAPAVVVIGHSIWQNRFVSDPAVIGREVLLDGTAHTVIGVMPEGFAFPKNHRFWTPLRARPSDYERREGPAIFIFGRLAPGVTVEQADAELSLLGRRTASAFPDTHAQLRPVLERYTHSLTGTEGILLWEVVQLQLMVTLLLIVVALNVAVLIYARTAARQSEIAVRTALGASRGRVVAQLFAEAFVLAAGAAVLGFALAQFGVRSVNRIMEVQWQVAAPFWVDYSVRPASVLLAVALAVLAATLTGVLPALQATGRRLQTDLRQHGGTGARLARTWTALVVAQIAVAVAALPAAVNLGWNVVVDAATRPTYPAEEFVAAELVPEMDSAAARGASDPRGRIEFGERLSELMRRLQADAAVAGVTFRTTLPGRTGRIRVEGVTPESPSGNAVASIGVHPGFIDVFGARMLSGRSFRMDDVGEDATAVIVNAAFVRQVLRGGGVLGRRIRFASARERAAADTTAERWYEIVGVSEDLLTNPVNRETVTPEVYYPVAPAQAERVTMTVRFRGNTPADFGSRFREIATEVDPALRLGTIRTLADRNRQELLIARLVGLIVGLVLVSVLLLSAAGIYAMMSSTVTERRREIGIRSALGAHPQQVLRSILARAAVQIASGVSVGVAVAMLVERLTGGGLLDGRGSILLPGFAFVMAIVALLATLGPARRGLTIQPTEVLRGE